MTRKKITKIKKKQIFKKQIRSTHMNDEMRPDGGVLECKTNSISLFLYKKGRRGEIDPLVASFFFCWNKHNERVKNYYSMTFSA